MTQTTRRTLCFGIGAISACGFPSDTTERPPPTDADIAARQPDGPVSGEGFAFGPEDETGISLGLKVENRRLRKGEKLRYHVALRNRGPKRRNVALYSNSDRLGASRSRTQLIVSRPDGTFDMVGMAVSETFLGSMPMSIDMPVDPGETRARPGTPLVVDAEGDVELYLLFGGRPFFMFEQVSGLVKIEVVP